MAQLKGNDLTEWIKALEPVDPESFKTMEKGTKIIHLDSITMEPDTFQHLQIANELHPDLVYYQTAGATYIGNYYERSTAGWFYFPEPAVEAELIKARQPGKVRELGDGKWKDVGVKGIW